MANVQVYTTTACPYCVAAKRLLQSMDIDFEEIDVSRDPDKRMWIAEQSGQRTVPQIFIDQKPIGGYTELASLQASGELNTLLGL